MTDYKLSVIEEIEIERERQMVAEGWSFDHDDQHVDGELARAAACYTDPLRFQDATEATPLRWPWSPNWWKPKNPRRDLIRAAALIVAEIERLDRRSAREGNND